MKGIIESYVGVYSIDDAIEWAKDVRKLDIDGRRNVFSKYMKQTLSLKDSALKRVVVSMKRGDEIRNAFVFLEILVKCTKNYVVLNSYCYDKFDRVEMVGEYEDYLKSVVDYGKALKYLDGIVNGKKDKKELK